MARYKRITRSNLILDDNSVDQLHGNEIRAAAEDAQPWRLVAGWALDIETGRPVSHRALEER